MTTEFLDWCETQSNLPKFFQEAVHEIRSSSEHNLLSILRNRELISDRSLATLEKEGIHKRTSTIQFKELEKRFSTYRNLQRALLPALAAVEKLPFFETTNSLLRVKEEIGAIDGALAECEEFGCVVFEGADLLFLAFCNAQKLNDFRQMGRGEQERSALVKYLSTHDYSLAFTRPETVAALLSDLRRSEGSKSSEHANKEIFYTELMKSGVPHQEALGKLLSYATSVGASDLHISPNLASMQVKCEIRVDGRISSVPADARIDAETYYALRDYVSQISEATSNGATIFSPCDGQTLTFHGHSSKKVRLRPAFMPLGIMKDTKTNPVKITIRVLAFEESITPLTDLGLNEQSLQHLKRAIDLSGKMFLLVGPVGQGKSTTLYSSLQQWVKDNPGKKAGSLEDPVEQYVEGVDQVQLSNKAIIDGKGYSEYLKRFLRHDLNAVVISEIRDYETLHAATHYAAVGSKIMSTLHARDEVGALQRALTMLEKEADKFMFISNIGYIFSQRLVPLLCPKCKEKLVLTDYEKKELKASADLWVKVGCGKSINELIPNFDELEFFKQNADGCTSCDTKGVVKRVPVLGILEFNDEVTSLMLSGRSERFVEVAKCRQATLQEQIARFVNNGECDVRNLNI
ncbi:Flp pilus assembly complex ATPase component TadA [Vibrio fluvialis]|nr:Flp pilus assembly complex ATPase component TadA [Vibrio fluvialis]